MKPQGQSVDQDLVLRIGLENPKLNQKNMPTPRRKFQLLRREKRKKIKKLKKNLKWKKKFSTQQTETKYVVCHDVKLITWMEDMRLVIFFRFWQEVEAKKLEEEMKKRRERIERWRAERKKKELEAIRKDIKSSICKYYSMYHTEKYLQFFVTVFIVFSKYSGTTD